MVISKAKSKPVAASAEPARRNSGKKAISSISIRIGFEDLSHQRFSVKLQLGVLAGVACMYWRLQI